MNNIYFAADTPENTIEILMGKSKNWFKGVTRTSYIDKIKRSWDAYHGEYYNDVGGGSHRITFGGEDGELVNLAVNHYRNLARHILNMVTATRPAFQCRAINTDRKSLIQAKLGNGLLDYYMREMRLEQVLKDAVEYAVVLGSGYVKLEWNSTKGKIYDTLDPDPDSIVSYSDDGKPLDINGLEIKAFPIYEGDVEFNLLSPFDVVFDTTKEYYDKNDWIICRTFKNKHDLAAKYPERAEEILRVDVKSANDDSAAKRYTTYEVDQTVDVPVYEFFHKKTESMPNGRYLMFLDRELDLEDSVMPYRSLPVHRIVPSHILGTPYGYTDMFDLLPLQEMLNSLYSTAATNITAFGVQSILSPRGSDIEFEQIGGGMQFIEYNAAAGELKPLQLTATSPEVYNMIQLLEKTMETLSGVNSVARGNPEQSLRSGNALALVQSQALQFVTGLSQSYNRLLEDVGTGLINLLKDFANVPRMASISGINNTSEMKEFKSDDIKSINRVVVDSANALMSTTAGKVQIAENLLQMGLIDSVDKYLMVLNTGNLDYITDSKIDNLTLIKAENEGMVRGQLQQAIWSERHSMHIKEHMEVLNDPQLKEDPELVQIVLDHVQEHVNLLRSIDPAVLAFVGEQPLAPAPAPQNQVQPGGPQGGPGPAQPQGVPMKDSNAPIQGAVNPNGQSLPSMPKPAGEGTILPDNLPQTPEDL